MAISIQFFFFGCRLFDVGPCSLQNLKQASLAWPADEEAQECLRSMQEALARVNLAKSSHMFDDTTRRMELDLLVDQIIKQQLVKIVVRRVNQEYQGDGAPWVAVFDDPGYLKQQRSENPQYQGVHFSTHVLFNTSVSRHQQTHIDGIGHRVDTTCDNLKDFQDPLSVAVLFTRHRATQVGEMYPVGNRFYDMLDGFLTPQEFLQEVNCVLDRNARTFEAEVGNIPLAAPGTITVFPKNLAVHRGLARGPKGKNEGAQDFRAAWYFTLCRQDRLHEYSADKLETAEFAPGFCNSQVDLQALEIWITQYLVALEVKVTYRSCCSCFLF